MQLKKNPSKNKLYTTVVQHLIDQGRPSYITTRGPYGGFSVQNRYRGPNNCRCAIGPFIPDQLYSESLEGKGVAEIVRLGVVPDWFTEHMDLLSDLQCAHDSWATAGVHKNSCPPRDVLFHHLKRTKKDHAIRSNILDHQFFANCNDLRRGK